MNLDGYAAQLAQREAELRALLESAARPEEHGDDVLDFKDMAVEETLATIDEAKAQQAAHELAQIVAAQRRLQEGSYGECVDCCDPIDLTRLVELAATPYCAACQSVHERQH